MSAEREADIDVVTDPNGLVGLEVGGGADGRVYLTEAGELAIDFTSDEGGDGVNVITRFVRPGSVFDVVDDDRLGLSVCVGSQLEVPDSDLAVW